MLRTWRASKFDALEIGSVQVSEGNRKLRSGIDSRAAVTVFPKTVAEDYPVLKTPGKAKSHRPASGKLLPDLGARKVQVKLQDRSFRCVSPRVADTHRALVAASEMNDMGHDVLFPRSSTEVSKRTRATRAVARSWSSKERMVYSSCQSSLFLTSGPLRSPTTQAHPLHSQHQSSSEA